MTGAGHGPPRPFPRSAIAGLRNGPDAAYLRLERGDNHHDLGLFGLGSNARAQPARSIGPYHLAWQVDTIDELARAGETLADELAEWTGVSTAGTIVVGEHVEP